MDFNAMMEKVSKANGFLAALDQSGGSTPKALKAYGVPDDVRFLMYTLNPVESFGRSHRRISLF